ncbi:MAG: response regulator [Planctomycetes bacterium]|nr:response regulator [Planctomycetota bacterium]
MPDTVGRMMEILLVEDSLVDACATIGALRHSQVKHRLTLVRDGEEAILFLQREGRFARAPRPDLVLLDLHLPKRDGFEVLTDMRADEHLQTIPVVVLTASNDEADRTRSQLLDVDCDNYLTKPVNLDKFVEVVRQMKHYWFTDLILAKAAV